MTNLILGMTIEHPLAETKSRLESILSAFENQYGMASTDFYLRFERGELGDAMDFMEWSAIGEMVNNLKKRVEDS